MIDEVISFAARPEFSGIVNFGLVVITGAYVILTRGILLETRRSVNELIKQRGDRERPRIVIFPSIREGNPLISLEVANIGQMAAQNLKISIDKDVYRFGKKADSSNLRDLPAFILPIAYFNVGQRLIFEFDTIGYLNDEENPKIFEVKLSYWANGENYIENQSVDFRPIVNSSHIYHPLHYEMKGIRDVLERKLK